MPPSQTKPSSHLAQSGAVFATNERLNQLLIEHLDSAVWTARTPGNVRTIAAIFTHMQNVRSKWIRLSAPHLKIPLRLGRAHCTMQQARKALAESAVRCQEMLAGVESGRIEKFVRDSWAKPWLASPELPMRMLCYMVSHEAHHRGQIAMLSHQLGHPLPGAITSKLWNWENLRG